MCPLRAKAQPAVGNQLAEGLTVDQLHGDEVDLLLGALADIAPGIGAGALDGVDRHDVGVVESRDRLGFALESLPPVRVGRELGRQHLERHLTFQPGVLGGIDLAHSAGPELA